MLLDDRDYGLFIIQIQDYVFNAIEDLVEWSVPGMFLRVKNVIQIAVDMAWRPGTTVEEWEDAAAQLARQLLERSAKAA